MRRPQQASGRAFRRQHSAARCRDRVPHPVGRGRAAPHAPARRRDRHPQDLDPLSAGCAGRRTRRSRSPRTCRRSSSCSGTARWCAKSRACASSRAPRPIPAPFETGYADMAIESWAVFERLQKAGVIPAGVKFQICIPTPIAPTYNNMVPGDRPALLPALTQHFLGEVAKIAQGAAQRPHRAAMGRVPGGAGLGGLLRQGPGRFPHRDDRRA